MPDRGRVAILISGRGSNMISLVEAMRDGRIPADPVVVLSNVPGAAGLERAREFGIATEVVDHRQYKPRKRHDQAVAERLQPYNVDLVCLAGYMRLLTPVMVEAFRGRMMNIHPSLLPAFPGLHAQRQAIQYGVRVAGCTVHFVDEECDHGPILQQSAVDVAEIDDEQSLTAKILEQEHLVYPAAVADFFAGVHLDGRRVCRDQG